MCARCPLPLSPSDYLMNELHTYNERSLTNLMSYKVGHTKSHQDLRRPAYLAYPLVGLKHQVAKAVASALGRSAVTLGFDLINREKFGGDVAIKFPELLAEGGPRVFMEKYQGKILETLGQPEFAKIFSKVVTKGMYINATLRDEWLLGAVQSVVDHSNDYGSSDALVDKTVVVDYSSPNVAKTLHAGHIRSTIIGHVVSNLYEGAGALVYRVNHINDFGGFGFILEGYRRYEKLFPLGMLRQHKLVEIYKIRRTLEKIVETNADLSTLPDAEREILDRYLPGVSTFAALKEHFDDYTVKSDERFAALENGDAEEVSLWEAMVQWSLTDFSEFYDSLDIHIPLVLGESFYFAAGNQLVDDALQSGKAVVYSDVDAQKDEAQLGTADLTEKELAKLTESIRKDIGATVVPLAQGKRYVVRRKDGRSIYSTRDLGAIKRRMELFAPTGIIYVVGQEQKEHFARLFEAAEALGLVDRKAVSLVHLSFGFYVDAKTGKKLSSRESVAGVTELLKASRRYFKEKFGSDEFSTEEADLVAKQLSIGSLVFNDVKQDIRGAVEIDSQSIQATLEGFEKSGGAYVVYAACRARGILRKLAAANIPLSTEEAPPLTFQEVELILKLLEIPEKVVIAARDVNPTTLVKHVHELAAQYNTYYASTRVISNGVANPLRIKIAHAVQIALTRGLALCHVQCPERI